MKKALIVVLLCVLVLSFVGTVYASNNKCKKLPCIATILPDGSTYICCYFRPAGDHCVVIERLCEIIE